MRQIHSLLFFLFPFQLFPFSAGQFPNCEQFSDDPACQIPQFSGQRGQGINFGGPQLPCTYQDLWLIPGKSDTSCTRPNARRLVEVDTKHVRIHPPVIKFPGCFTVEIRNVRVLDAKMLSNSIFAKSEYQWLNVRGSENSKCQNSSLNGCGGFGNNCYYCDICESLKMVADQKPAAQSGGIPAGIADQLQGMNCPKEPGVYTFRKQFCFNDWSWLDSDGDCRLDFLSGADEQNGLREAMAALQQVGYGTVVAKIRLAYNASQEIVRKKMQKEAQIERIVGREIEQKRREWKGTAGGTFEEYRRWQLERKKGQWHAEEYLPWLLYENEFACIRLTFDVCERSPQQRWDGSSGFTCI